MQSAGAQKEWHGDSVAQRKKSRQTGKRRRRWRQCCVRAPPRRHPKRLDTSSAIVGVGASAGGLEAFTELLSHLPDDTGMAFVLIQHLDPNHESHLTELLSKESKMPVAEVKGETRAEANHVYVIPPQRNLGISDGVLHDPAAAGPRPQHADRRIPSRAWRRTAAARPSASFSREPHPMERWDSRRSRPPAASPSPRMWQPPSSTACREAPSPPVWWTLYWRRPESRANWWPSRGTQAAGRVSRRRSSRRERSELAKILRLVRSATGVDFTHYKHGTLARRIKRRMALRGFEKLEDYSRDLEQNREEATALCENCFITVTAFFREPAVFEELKKKVFPGAGGEPGARGSDPDLGARVRLGRGGLFDRHLPDGIPGRDES